MRLVSCHIENFGKLKDLTLDFDQGCNVIFQENGWGKSTLAAFIKVMLYGFEEEKSRDELKNERKRYKPWQGGVYGGRLEFEADGEHYVVTRTFGAREKEDEFSLRKKSTNLECQDYSANLGEELFSLDSGSFCRTVFISQNDCETTATDAVNAKIGNLAEATDDINNYESVNQRFLNLINQMSPTRKTGSLCKMKDEISRLEENVRVGRRLEQAMEGIAGHLHEKLTEQKTLKEEQASLLERQREIGAFKDIQVKREKYKSLCQEFEERKNRVEKERSFFPVRVPGMQELEDVIAESTGLSAAKESVLIYSMTEEELEQEKRLEQLFQGGCPDLEVFRVHEQKLHEMQNLRVLLAENQLSGEETARLSDFKKRFSQGVPELKDFERVISDWNRCVERKNVLEQKRLTYDTLKDISLAGLRNEKPKRNGKKTVPKSGMALLFLGAVLILSGILLGTVGNRIVPGIIVGILGLLSLGTGAAIMRKKTGTVEETGAVQAAGDSGENDSLERMGRQIAEDEEFIGRVGEETKRFLENYGIVCERETEVLDRLYELKTDVREYITLSDRGRAVQQEEQLARYRELSKSIRTFLEGYYPGERLEETGFASVLAKCREAASKYAELKQKRSNLLKARQIYGQLFERLQKFMEGISMTAEEDLQAQLLQIQSHIQSFENSMQEYRTAKERKEAFESEENIEEILRHEPVQDTEDMQGINHRLEEIAGRLEQIYEYVGDYIRQLDELREESDNVSEEAQRLAELKTEYGEDQRKYELLKKTRELLEQAKIMFTSKYTEPISASLAKYYGLLSGEQSDKVYVDANTSVTIDEQGMQREPRFFSAGYRDMFGVCMRMALVDAMYQQEKPFLIFDDPFANLDGSKLKGALKLMDQVGREYQVLYFTCHSSRMLKQ